MERLTEFTLRRRRAIVAVWVVLTLAGAWAASGISDALSQSFDAPGRPAFEANREILKRFGNGALVPPVVVVSRGGSRAELGGVERAVRRAVPRARVAGSAEGSARAFVSRDGSTAFVLAFPPPGRASPDENPAAVKAVRAAVRDVRVGGRPVAVTGVDALNDDGGGGGGIGLLAEVLLGGLGALVVLAVVFASRLALVPLVVAAVSILSTFLVLRGLAALTDVSFVVQFLVGLIGLGVAIDYSLLIVVRWREERDTGHDGTEAVRRAMATAGKAVVVSGTTVAIGLLALVTVPVPSIRSMGFGGLLIPVVSVLVCLTLLPGFLATAGQRLDAKRVGREREAGRQWTRWSTWVVRHRIPAAVAGLAVLVALAVAATGLHPGDPSVDSQSSAGPAKTALDQLERSGLGDGTLTPVEVLVSSGSADAAARRLGRVAGVRAVVAPGADGWSRGGRRALAVLPRHDASSDQGEQTLNALRHLRTELPGRAAVGGPSAQTRDLTDAIYGAFPLMAALIALVTFLLLARALRSVVLPLKAVALNVLSIGSAFGIVVIIWQHGAGSEPIGGVPGTGAITNWAPLAIFAFLYGLSMDYEVFILSRMREEYDRTGSTEQAIVHGLGRTGRLVTSAALILFLAFVALAAGPTTDIKILATGLAAGILLDATVVRALVVPALVELLGRANWWMPGWLARVLRTRA